MTSFPKVLTTRLRTLARAISLDFAEVESQNEVVQLIRILIEDAKEFDFYNKTKLWRLLVAVAGTYPNSADVEIFANELSISNPIDIVRVALRASSRVMSNSGSPSCSMVLLEDAYLSDTDVSARTSHNTGIQRVVRNCCREWSKSGVPFTPVVWSDESNAYRLLSELESQRLTNWSESSSINEDSGNNASLQPLVLPIGGTLLLMEVPSKSHSPQLAALAKYSGLRVVLIGYDFIPLTSAEFLPHEETEKFASYLEVVKHSDLVVAISESAGIEFQGFAHMLPTQGLPELEVTSLALPIDIHDHHEINSNSTKEIPLALCLGSIEPRKNQMNALLAAEKCWDLGLNFELLFIGGGINRYSHSLKSRVKKLRSAGNKVDVLQNVKDDQLHELFQQSTFSIFVSLHEGYGLPIAESLAYGKPVVVSNYGSMAEVARYGNCVLVDPKSPSSIAEGISSLLTDIQTLDDGLPNISEARTWKNYASELWRLSS